MLVLMIALGPNWTFLLQRVGCSGSSEDWVSGTEGGPSLICRGPKPAGVGFELGSVVDSEGGGSPANWVLTSASEECLELIH